MKGTLYGATSRGGAYGKGTVFSLSINGAESVLHSFGDGSDGAHPQASLTAVNGTLYGTTEKGGTRTSRCPKGCGTIFALTP